MAGGHAHWQWLCARPPRRAAPSLLHALCRSHAPGPASSSCASPRRSTATCSSGGCCRLCSSQHCFLVPPPAQHVAWCGGAHRRPSPPADEHSITPSNTPPPSVGVPARLSCTRRAQDPDASQDEDYVAAVNAALNMGAEEEGGEAMDADAAPAQPAAAPAPAPAPAGGNGAAAAISAASLAAALGAALSGAAAGGQQRALADLGPSLGDVLKPEALAPLLQSPELVARLAPYLPEEHRWGGCVGGDARVRCCDGAAVHGRARDVALHAAAAAAILLHFAPQPCSHPVCFAALLPPAAGAHPPSASWSARRSSGTSWTCSRTPS